MFRVNEKQCKAIGKEIAKIQIQSAAFDQLAPKTEDPHLSSLVFFYIAGICHQTQGLEGYIDDKYTRGWDYLMAKFVDLAKKHPEKLAPSYIKNIQSEDLRAILSDNGDPNTSTVSEAAQRVEFLRDMAEKLEENYDGNPLQIFKEAKNCVGGKEGVYERMKIFLAYGKDVLCKKSTVLTTLMTKSDLVPRIDDPENLIHMIDYHRERFLLRTGCIQVSDEDVAQKLKHRTKQDSSVDNSLRTEATRACQLILPYSGKDFFEVEHLLWAFGRSYCHDKDQICCEKDLPAKTGNFSSYAIVSGDIAICPFETDCQKLTDYWQPNVDTTNH